MDVLVTGVAGSGKTTIARELAKRGYDARDMDSMHGLCAWVDLKSGIPNPDFKITNASDWVDRYDWLWSEERITELLNKSALTYFCGSSGNQEQFYPFFDKIFLLEMNEKLIRERVLNSDRDHNYGRMPGELEAIFGYYEEFQDKAKAAGAIVIDAKQSLDQNIGQILAETI